MVKSPGFIVLALVFLGAVADCYNSSYNVQRSLGVPLTLFATSLLFGSVITSPLQSRTIHLKSASAPAESGLKPRGVKLGTVVETTGLDDDEKRALKTMSNWVATSLQRPGSSLSVDDMTAMILKYQEQPGTKYGIMNALMEVGLQSELSRSALF
ncbi:hypothetical protein LZ30DRAFT_741306 [Colletotrichum cereale]|nr:hypothetical protein LZ30DRAFT_741306 [Colletotrichum cereale]